MFFLDKFAFLPFVCLKHVIKNNVQYYRLVKTTYYQNLIFGHFFSYLVANPSKKYIFHKTVASRRPSTTKLLASSPGTAD